jgi:hypothetical protein
LSSLSFCNKNCLRFFRIGCEATATVSVKVNSCNFLDDFSPLAGVRIFQNPAKETVDIQSDTLMELKLLNGLSQVIRDKSLSRENSNRLGSATSRRACISSAPLT